MQVSARGRYLSRPSGIRSILADVAAADRSSAEERFDIGPGGPSVIPAAVAVWRRLAEDALAESFVMASCQAGPARGSKALVSAIVDYFNAAYGWSIGPENVAVSAGSRLLCFMMATLFTGVRPLLLPRLPDCAGYLALGPVVRGVESTVVIEGKRRFRYAIDVPAVQRQSDIGMMLISNPANPTGGTVTQAELAVLVGHAERHDVPLMIDHAHGKPFPRVAGTDLRPMSHPNVVNCFTLSKAGLPGERLAFVIGSADLVVELVSGTADLIRHAPQLVQTMLERALVTREIDVLSRDILAPHYQDRRQMAEELLHSTMPTTVNWRLHSSNGGMFCWLWFDDDRFDDVRLYDALARRRVFVTPGRHFFVGPYLDPGFAQHTTRCVRLNLSPDEWVVGESIVRLGETVDELLGSAAPR